MMVVFLPFVSIVLDVPVTIVVTITSATDFVVIGTVESDLAVAFAVGIENFAVLCFYKNIIWSQNKS